MKAKDAEVVVKLMFWPWYLTAYTLGGLALLAGLDKYQTPEGRRYNEQNFKRAEEGIKDVFK